MVNKAPPIDIPPEPEVKAKLTPKSDKKPKQVVLRVFWKSNKKWDASTIQAYQKFVVGEADFMRSNYVEMNEDGETKKGRFTCEDFALRMLIEFASKNSLPVKLTTGVRTYSNIEIYSSDEHDDYSANAFGFFQMVGKTYGAPDMQSPINTKLVATVAELKPGDILAQANDKSDKRAHHIQMVIAKTSVEITIFQGNSGSGNWGPLAKLSRLIGRGNPADPKAETAYTGATAQKAKYTLMTDKTWSYSNEDTKSSKTDFLKMFLFYRWNFENFNR